jgi:hypothetical protein
MGLAMVGPFSASRGVAQGDSPADRVANPGWRPWRAHSAHGPTSGVGNQKVAQNVAYVAQSVMWRSSFLKRYFGRLVEFLRHIISAIR